MEKAKELGKVLLGLIMNKLMLVAIIGALAGAAGVKMTEADKAAVADGVIAVHKSIEASVPEEAPVEPEAAE